ESKPTPSMMALAFFFFLETFGIKGGYRQMREIQGAKPNRSVVSGQWSVVGFPRSRRREEADGQAPNSKSRTGPCLAPELLRVEASASLPRRLRSSQWLTVVFWSKTQQKGNCLLRPFLRRRISRRRTAEAAL